MAERQLDPARLEGEQLRRWYLRSPDEVERERQAVIEQRSANFFRGASTAAQGAKPPNQRPDTSGFDALWVADGSGGYRAVRPKQSDFLRTLEPDGTDVQPAYLPENAAAPETGDFVGVGNPHNSRLRREWELARNEAWPRTTDGRPYDVAHIKAIADGGTNTLDNIQPMDPADHRASHKEDSSRWGKRSGIARAFGGRVEPPAHAPRPSRGPSIRGFSILDLLPNMLGVINGRIRTDTPVHTWNDMLGYSSEDDLPAKDLAV